MVELFRQEYVSLIDYFWLYYGVNIQLPLVVCFGAIGAVAVYQLRKG